MNYFMIRKAIKILDKEKIEMNGSNSSIGAAITEINVLRSIRNDFILQYYEYFVEEKENDLEEDRICIVTDFCEVK